MVFGLENLISNEYLRAFIVLIGVFIILRIFMWVLEKVILKATSKTKTEKDDEFVKKVSKPVTIFVFLIGIRVAIEELNLTGTTEEIFGNVIFSLVVISLGFIAYYFVDIFLFVALRKTMGGEESEVRESLMSIINGVVKVIMVSLVFLYILEGWGIEIGPFIAGLGIAGIAIAFALQASLSNIFGGVSMILDKSIKVGDLIYLDNDTKGRVAHIGIRSTKILTFNNEYIIVPNSKVADSNIQNIGMPNPKSRVIIPFGVAYGSEIQKVKDVVMEEIKQIANFVDDPEPSIKFLEMADSSLNFKAYFYVNSYENRFGAIDEANTRIYNALNRNEIEIPFPQMDVHVKKDENTPVDKSKFVTKPSAVKPFVKEHHISKPAFEKTVKINEEHPIVDELIKRNKEKEDDSPTETTPQIQKQSEEGFDEKMVSLLQQEKDIEREENLSEKPDSKKPKPLIPKDAPKKKKKEDPRKQHIGDEVSDEDGDADDT